MDNRSTPWGGAGAAADRRWLYDPRVGALLVRAHRSAPDGAGDPGPDDAVWTDVLVALRWAEAATRCPADLVPGAAWRTARACAATLARLPALCVVRGEAWPVRPVEDEPTARSAAQRLTVAADRLLVRLRDPAACGPVVDLAEDVEALGAAALALLAEGADWSTVR